MTALRGGNDTRPLMTWCPRCGDTVYVSKYIDGELFVICDSSDPDCYWHFSGAQPKTVEEAVDRWNQQRGIEHAEEDYR